MVLNLKWTISKKVSASAAVWIVTRPARRHQHYAFHRVKITATVNQTRKKYIVISMMIHIKVLACVAAVELPNLVAYRQSVSTL